MIKKIPKPISGGLILSYKCPSECRHCIYACSPKWNANWISQGDLEKILSQLAGKILPGPYGPDTTSLNYGLHFTGGEPFVNFDLLSKAVEIAGKLKIPSTFVETNCFWCADDKSTKDKLKHLKNKGMKGIMISVNPFYLEYVPFKRTERAIRISLEVFGRNVMVYQLEYYRRFKEWGFKDRVPFEDYMKVERKQDFLNNVEFLVMGRAPYKLKDIIQEFYSGQQPDYFLKERCMPTFLRTVHNHFDNSGNYMPGFCGGISLGDCRKLDELLKEGVDTEHYPVLGFLIEEDLKGLLEFARDFGYSKLQDGYFSKCHLCMDIRRHLALKGDFKELSPKEFYLHLE